MSKGMKVALITGVFVLLGAIISGIFLYNSTRYAADHSHSTPTVSQSSTKGSNIAVTGDSNQVIAGNTGPTVVSIGQSGGVTALNYYNITQVTQAASYPHENRPSATKGAICTIDSVNKTITIRPKSGEWNIPFIAIPLHQIEAVQPHLSSETQSSLVVSKASIFFEGDSLQQYFTTAPNATPQTGYIFHYSTLPTYFIFGDRAGPFYKAIHSGQVIANLRK